MSERVLNELRASPLFTRVLPSRIVHTHAEWATLDEEARAKPTQVGVEAIRLLPEWKEIQRLVESLAAYAPATATLIALWKVCPVTPIRHSAGHALLRSGSAEAYAGLVSTMSDATDFLALSLAVRALIKQEPTTAYARTRMLFEEQSVRAPGGSAVPNAILWFFRPGAFDAKGPIWTEPRAPSWLDEDWLRLCARLRRHDLLGANARAVLVHADGGAVEHALAVSPLPGAPTSVSSPIGDLVSRYTSGEYERVWNDMRAYASIDGDLREEVLAVARLTMRRVRNNVDLVSQRLAALKWRALSGELQSEPTEEDGEVIAEIEEITGASIPPSVRAFWEEVGGVDFVWNYELGDAPNVGIDLVEADPLSVAAARSARYLLDEWRDTQERVPTELRDPYALDLAPDYLHKANISGGAPYGVELPFYGADPVWENEEHSLPFVDYLRLCFRWAGFPRLERTKTAAVEAFVRDLGRDLIPF
jgi:hypothetical protein